MVQTPLMSTRRGFLKMAAFGGSLPAMTEGAAGQSVSSDLLPNDRHEEDPKGLRPPASSARTQQLDHDALRHAINLACSWITDVAQMKTDSLTNEHNSHNLQHHHWRGALPGEYRVSTGQWDFFCPVWQRRILLAIGSASGLRTLLPG